MKIKLSVLKAIYITSFAVLGVLVVFTPLLVTGRIFIFEEERAEGIILLILLVLGFVINYFYQRELRERQSELGESLRYIGALNVQVEKIRELNQGAREYPQDKAGLMKAYQAFAETVLGFADCDWTGFRIVDHSQRVLSEYFFDRRRGRSNAPPLSISNKDLLASGSIAGLSVFSNFASQSFCAYCIIPKENLTEGQKVLAQAAINNLAMLYAIYRLSAAGPARNDFEKQDGTPAV